MFGILLAFFGNFFGEFSASFGKQLLKTKELSIYLYGAMNYFSLVIFFFAITLFKGETLVFGGGVLLFLTRFVFEVIQSEAQLRALEFADRTTFGFLRALTIPLLLIVDIVLGYTLTMTQLLGVLLVTFSLVFMFYGSRVRHEGFYLSLFSAVNAVITISIYKYDITHFRSVAVEGFYLALLLALYLGTRSLILHGRDVLRLLRRPSLIFLVTGNSVASVLVSFAYQYGPASLILAMVRAGALFWSFFSGALYFHEGEIRRKFVVLSFLLVAAFLMF